MLTDFFNKKQNINIYVPNFHHQVFLNICFFTLQENNKEVFRNNFVITAAEGCFACSIWSLNRDNRYVSLHDMEATLKIYAKHNIAVNYVFDNELISKEDLNDNFSNLMLKIAHKEGNGVYVASELLYNYIKEKYPLYKVIKYAAPEEFDKKNILIADEYNNQFDTNAVKNKETAYLTLNPLCPVSCKYYEEHRKYISNEQIGYYNVSDIYLCPLKPNYDFYDLMKNSNFITVEQMQGYISEGFCNFRISFPSFERCMGFRYNIYDTIESYIYYLIKPEYQKEIRYIIMKKFAGNKKNG